MWIELNIPWEDNSSPTVKDPYVSLVSSWKHNKERLKYREEAERPLTESKDMFDNLFTRFNKLLEKKCKADKKNNDSDVISEKIYAKHPEFLPVKKYRQLTDEVSKWVEAHPKYIKYQEQFEKQLAAIKQRSFCGRGLNKSGTVVEVEDAGQIKILVIGDINQIGGVCDDCVIFSNKKNAIVKRYKVLDY